MSSKQLIDYSNIPKHIAIIMDGNGRWAKKHNMPRVFGHQNGVKAVRQVTEVAAEIGVKYLTLYAFSKENWKRPAIEVDTLMNLFVKTVGKELDTLNKNKIRLMAIGEIDKLPTATYRALQHAMINTKDNKHMTLILALNYSARWEIVNAAKKIGTDIQAGLFDPEDLTEEQYQKYLSTPDFPDPDLMIRTSGEFRVSNFLLWQLSYSELYFTNTLWPDFSKENLFDAIYEFQQRERRFGSTSEQLTNS